MQQVSVGIFLRPINPVTGPRFADDYYQAAYWDLFNAIENRGGRAILVSDEQATYMGSGVFSEYWTVTENRDEYIHHNEPIELDVLYNKARFVGDGAITVISNPQLETICADKSLSYKEFPELHPNTWLVNSKQELSELLQSKAGRHVVKGLDSNGGKQVWIDDVEVLARQLEEFPERVIVQEYIETNVGIPGIVDGRHDLRVGIFDGEIIHARLRTPLEGGFLSNIGQGGKHGVINPETLPADVVSITKDIIDKAFQAYGHRFYCVDFGNTAEGWKIFELNAWPGIVPVSEGPEAAEYIDKLAANLVSLAYSLQKVV